MLMIVQAKVLELFVFLFELELLAIQARQLVPKELVAIQVGQLVAKELFAIRVG
jgi:hypothetical protein